MAIATDQLVATHHNLNVSAGNSAGHPKAPDTWYISVMDKSFGIKISVLKDLPLGYIHTKNELKPQIHWAVKRRFIIERYVKTQFEKCS